jgi:arylsulfatase A-like enzyme/Ca2+-binding EF-hand superfamily protein
MIPPSLPALRCIALACGCILLSPLQAAETKPNILLIVTDDQGYHDLSCQGATDFKTPNIDRIADEGIRFEAGYVTAPQCAPSRAGLISGMSQARFGLNDNNHDPGLPPRRIMATLPEQLRDLGYDTGLIGKWHIGYGREEDKSKRLIPGNLPWERGFDYAAMIPGGGMHYFPWSGRKDAEKYLTRDSELGPVILKRNPASEPKKTPDMPPETYLTDFFSDRASEFVRGHTEKPWFLYLAYNAPHVPCMAPEDKMAKYAHLPDKKRRTLAAMMDSVDEGVGRVLRALDDTDQTNRTIVWFLSDNGGPTDKNGSRNDPFSGWKGHMHEGGIRVPFLIRWPDQLPAGQVVKTPVISLDILPTCVKAAGAKDIAAVHEGVDLLPMLTGKGTLSHRALHWSWRSNYTAIRVGDLKETRNPKDVRSADGKTVPGHVFTNIVENPQELAGKSELSAEHQDLLTARLDDWLGTLRSDAATAEYSILPLIVRVIKAADKNRNDKITLDEFLPLDVQARHHGEEHFKEGDKNGDGFLDAEELAAELARKQTWYAILSEGTEACFNRIDANGDGKLDAKEYRTVSRMGGHAEQHHRSADQNGDGLLDLAEFTTHANAKLVAAAKAKFSRKWASL